MTQEKELDFREKLLKYTKLTKPRTTSHALVLSGVVIVALVTMTFLRPASQTQQMTAEQLPTLEILENLPDEKISMAISGDVMLGRFTTDAARVHNESLLGDARQLFAEADLSLANLETPIIEDEIDLAEARDRNIYFRTDPQFLDQVTDVDLFMLANNHATDYGRESIQHTIDHLDAAGTAHVGGGENLAEAYEIHYEDFDGFTVSFVNFTDVIMPELTATETEPGVASMNLERALPTVRRASESSDLTVVNVHWGVEYKTHPTKRQRSLAESLADVGADVIVGHHPHVLQPIDMVNGALVFYSLGNIVTDQGWSDTRETAVPVLVIDKETEQIELYVEPFRVTEARPRNLAGGLGLYRNKLQYKLQRGSEIDFERHESVITATIP